MKNVKFSKMPVSTLHTQLFAVGEELTVVVLKWSLYFTRLSKWVLYLERASKEPKFGFLLSLSKMLTLISILIITNTIW